MKQKIIIALKLFLVFSALLGILYPVSVFVFGQILFPSKSNGSLIVNDGKVLGSEIIAQQFNSAKYFQPRPSAVNYDATNSGGSNLAPTSQALMRQIKSRIDTIRIQNPDSTKLIPIELVTASGSGLDPHISLDAAYWQTERIAKARNIDISLVKKIIDDNCEYSLFGFLGEKRVNVLKLNLVLDSFR
jgi:potassium-transporting ATPase KdpC subunit